MTGFARSRTGEVPDVPLHNNGWYVTGLSPSVIQSAHYQSS